MRVRRRRCPRTKAGKSRPREGRKPALGVGASIVVSLGVDAQRSVHALGEIGPCFSNQFSMSASTLSVTARLPRGIQIFAVTKNFSLSSGLSEVSISSSVIASTLAQSVRDGLFEGCPFMAFSFSGRNCPHDVFARLRENNHDDPLPGAPMRKTRGRDRCQPLPAARVKRLCFKRPASLA